MEGCGGVGQSWLEVWRDRVEELRSGVEERDGMEQLWELVVGVEWWYVWQGGGIVVVGRVKFTWGFEGWWSGRCRWM